VHAMAWQRIYMQLRHCKVFNLRPYSIWREKPTCQIIDHFFTKAVPSTDLPDEPDKQCTVDEDASSEESSNVGVIGNADVSITFASQYITMHRSFTSTSYYSDILIVPIYY
jgi:hypothetical protein